MNKRFSIIALAACAFALCLALAGCTGSNGSGSGSASVDSSTLAGTWQLVEEDGVTAAEVTKRDDNGFAEFLILQDDGTVLYEYLGDYYKGTYESKSAGEASLDVRHWTDALTLQDGKLTVERSEGGTATFKKIDDATREAYDEKQGYDPAVLTNANQTKELNQVLVDDEYCTITAASAYEKSASVGYNLTVVNKTDNKLALRAMPDSFTVNGEKQAGRMQQDEIPAGQTASLTASFSSADLGGGLDKLVNVRFQVEAIELPSVKQLAVYDIAL